MPDNKVFTVVVHRDYLSGEKERVERVSDVEVDEGTLALMDSNGRHIKYFAPGTWREVEFEY